MVAVTEKKPRKKVTEKVPDYLIKEVIGGIPFYYKGYKDVLNETKTKEEIMGCSSLQSIIIQYLMLEVCAKLSRKKYWMMTNEPGNNLGQKNNLSYDIAIVEKTVLTPDKVSRKYMSVPPHLVVEVDVQVELAGTGIDSFEDFIFFKTSEIFKFGVNKLIWVMSRSKKVVVAENGKPWQIFDWSEELEFLDGVNFNVAKYLEEEGINPDI